jgi:3-oxoadipate enol-lactonase / 4-carboxymuconolactone decarboxylase
MTVAVNYRIEGPDDGPVVVLGNSLGTDLTMWDPCAERLVADGLRVVRYDHRGQGGSPDAGGEPTIDDLGGDVIALLDRLEIERAAYVGVSVGGMVAQWLAANAPERIYCVGIFCSSAYPGNPENWETRSATVLETGSTEAIAETVVGRWITAEFAQAHPDVREWLLTMVRASPAAGYARLCRMLGGLDLRPQLASINVPTLVVAGAQDESLPPADSEVIAEAIAGSYYELLDPAAHIPMVQRPEYVAELICEHIEEATYDRHDVYDAGMKVRREVLGDAHVDRAVDSTTDFNRRFQTLITEYAWGTVWHEETLDRKTRSCITLALLCAFGHHDELAMHVRAALNNGLSAEEISEVLVHTSVYAGVPATNTALKIAEIVLREERAL